MNRGGRFSIARNPGPDRALRRLGSLLGLLLLSAGAPADESVTAVSAPEFAAVLEARQGKVVLVNFWATWCRPCLEEIPDLMALEAELAADGFDLVAVSLDDPGALDDTVKPFLAKWFPTFSTFLSVETEMDTMVSVVDAAWNEVLPTSYVIARDGSVAKRIQGGSSKEEFAAAVRPVL
jgi:thiol-disulfide isomerase/thioredoxin